LLAVLWLSAALAAIAFSVASTVRAETERASTLADGVRTYYLATGALARALVHVAYGPRDAALSRNTPYMSFNMPGGQAIVEVIPDTAKLSLNEGKQEDFEGLLRALGVEPERAREIAAGIIHWRTPSPGGAFDQFYASRTPTFQARHASFEEVEEVLLVKGMTPEIFHGSYVRDAQGRLVRQSAFKDCVSVYGTAHRFDANSADPAIFSWLGFPPDDVRRIMEARRLRPFRDAGELGQIGGPGANRLMVGGNTIYTIRATARLRLGPERFSDLRRSVSALVKLNENMGPQRIHILRWNDNAVSEVSAWW